MVVLGVARVDDQQVLVLAHLVDDHVINKSALGIEQGGVVGLAFLKLRGVVHADPLDGVKRLGAANHDVAHVGDVEHAHAGAHGQVLLHQTAAGGILHRHVPAAEIDRKSTRLNSSHQIISYAVFCLKKKI